MNRLWFAVGYCSLALFLSLTSFAEHEEGTSLRPFSDSTLTEKIWDFIDKNFEYPKKDAKKKNAKLAEAALETSNSTSKDSLEARGKLMAKLYGMVNDDQAKAIEKAAKEEKTDDKNSFQIFLEATEWSKRLVLGLDTKGIPEEFKKAFLEQWKQVQKDNEEFYKLLEDARKGDEKAKKKLVEKYGEEVLDRFALGQALSGNDALGNKLLSAKVLGHTTPEGNTVLARKNGDSFTQVDLGNDQLKYSENARKIEQQLQAKGESLKTTQALSRPLTDEELKDARKLQAPETPTEKPQAPPPPPTETPSPKAHTPSDEKLARILTDRGCIGCHLKGTHKLFDQDGFLVDSTKAPRLAEVLDGKGLKSNGRMKEIIQDLHNDLSQDEKNSLLEWAEEKKLNIPSLKKPSQTPAPTTQVAPQSLPAFIPEGIEDSKQKGLFKDADEVQPADLAERIKQKKTGDKFHVIDTGGVGKIPGAFQFGGFNHGKPKESLAKWAEKLSKFESENPNAKNEEVILYCGCCSIEMCPVFKALALLKHHGYTNVKVLMLKESFKEDWADKNFPTEA